MKCTYCNQKMIVEHIHAAASHAVYWTPEISKIEGMIRSDKKFEIIV